MSDEEYPIEGSVENKLAAVYTRIFVTLLACCIGWIVFWIGLNFDNLFNHNSSFPFVIVFSLLGMIIAPGPMILRMLNGGFSAAFKTQEYEVITTYADGRKESDGGAESAMTGLVLKFIALVIMIAIGSVFTLIYLLYLLIYYLILFVQVKPKPNFFASGFFLYIIGFLVLIMAPILAGGVHVEIDHAELNKFLAEKGLANVNWRLVLGLVLGIPILIGIVVKIIKGKKNKGTLKSVSQAAAQPATSTGKSKVKGDVFAQAQPTQPDSEENYYSAGDFIWARWSQDGNLYFAQIIGVSDSTVSVCYTDGTREDLSTDDIFYLPEALESGLTPFGDWNGGGYHYECVILEMNDTSVLVQYTEDGTQEEMPYKWLLFRNT